MDRQAAEHMPATNPVQRVRIWYAVLLLVFGIFAVRVFYLQVIRYDYYKKAALSDQLKQYEVPAQRGIISAHLGDGTVPIVLNQKLYTLYADPTIVKNAERAAGKLQPIVGGNTDLIEKKLRTPVTRYVVLGKRLTPAQSAKVLAMKLPGIGTLEQEYRTYPQGVLASQLLGFVNDDSQGVYGVEQALDDVLAGTPGQLKAVTDINGVPLAASGGNLSTLPVPGQDVTLTVDIGMQAGLEKILKAAQEKYQSRAVSAVVMDVHTGAIKAMGNYPTFDPAAYQQVEDPVLYENLVVTHPIEPGSITKVFTTTTALNKGVITPTSSFYDPGSWTIDSRKIADVEQDHSTGQQTVLSTLDKSLNTGATWMLMQMGGGEVNKQARVALHEYFSDRFMFGQASGVEQGDGEEASGYLPGPTNTGAGINLTYANMSFGQAYTATALQMGAALGTVVNGGSYYQPYLVEQVTDSQGTVHKTRVAPIKTEVVSEKTSRDMVTLLEQNNTLHIREGFPYLEFGPRYSVGGKTGTAEIADPKGGYRTDKFNGTYLGFIGGDTPQYAIVVYNLEPSKYYGFAGSGTAQPIFANIAHMLVDSFGVTPKK